MPATDDALWRFPHEPEALDGSSNLSEPPEGPLMSAAEIAELFRVHPSTIRRMAREGRIPVFWVGSTPRFDAAEVAATFRSDAQPKTRPPDRRRTRRSVATTEVDRERLRAELYG